MKKMYFVLILLPAAAFGIFERDNASVLAQQEQWQQANDKLQKLVVQNYDNPDLLYDAGVTSFKTKAFEQARAYFQQVKEHANVSLPLKEQACFNLGNSCVELNKLEDAIEQYQAALDINPENEWAKHNLERVKEMLQQQQQEQQQQEQQQNQDQNQDKEQNKDQQDQQNQNNDSSQNQQQSQQQQGGNQQNQSDQNKSEQGEQQNDGSQQQQSESSQDQHQQRNANSGADQHGEQQQKQNQEQNTEKEKEGNRDQQTQNDSQENNADQKQNEKLDHTVNPAQQQTAQQSTPQVQDMQESEKTQREAQMAGETEEEAGDLKDKWLIQVLQEREKSDKKATKQIMKATIDNQLAGKHGQNCW